MLKVRSKNTLSVYTLKPLGAASSQAKLKYLYLLLLWAPTSSPLVGIIGLVNAYSYITRQPGSSHCLAFPVANFILGVFLVSKWIKLPLMNDCFQHSSSTITSTKNLELTMHHLWNLPSGNNRSCLEPAWGLE